MFVLIDTMQYNNPTINFIGAVDDCVGGMSISDKIHTILLTVEGPFWSNTGNTKKRSKSNENILIVSSLYYIVRFITTIITQNDN